MIFYGSTIIQLSLVGKFHYIVRALITDLVHITLWKYRKSVNSRRIKNNEIQLI